MLTLHRIQPIVAFALALAGCAGHAAIPPSSLSSVPASEFARRTSVRTGVVVPMYMYPGKIWKDAIAAAVAHPNVPMTFIANVYNGPGTKIDSTYVAYIEKAQKAGIYVLGYVYTSYGKRSQKEVHADMLSWQSMYHPDGIFLDEMGANATYYRAATTFAHNHYLWYVMGNPGVDAPGNSGPDVINYYEQRNYPSLGFMSKSAHLQYAKSRWSYMAGAVPYNASAIQKRAQYVGYFYATDGTEPECYCKLPTYFSKLVALLDTK